MATAIVAKTLEGELLYQRRARRALPILVRQAFVGETLTYKDLAREMSVPYVPNLNYVLGSVGQSLIKLGKDWGETIPPIQTLVVNQKTGLPGVGIGEFLTDTTDFRKLSLRDRRQSVDHYLRKVYTFTKWLAVLQAYQIEPTTSDFSNLTAAATKYRGAFESEAHIKLKEFVAANPKVVGLSKTAAAGEVEVPLPSGDSLDVLFTTRGTYVAAEVKSLVSSIEDITRGLYQCVKYRAVLEAWQRAKGVPQSARAVLVLETRLPVDLVALKNVLGVEVVEEIKCY